MSRGVFHRWRRQVQRIGRWLAIAAVAAATLSIGPGGGGPRAAATGLAWAQQSGKLEARDALTELLCCGRQISDEPAAGGHGVR
jgi:branched-subunit amino acid permease